MQYLLSFTVTLLPILSITFVMVLVSYKLYIHIRSCFKVNANCWFCNQNTRVPYLEANSFVCSHCDQYNGFTKDGDYNREIYEQLDCSNLSTGRKGNQNDFLARQFPSNGFCKVCNESQRLKIEKLAQFEPKNESRFDEELKAFKNELEEQYRLCTTCEHHLKRVLREKKKMVLGAKFLDFILKGAETFKQPYLTRLKNAKNSNTKNSISTYLAILALANAFCILRNLPDLTKSNVTHVLGDNVGHYVFLWISYVLAAFKVLASYSDLLSGHPFLQKLGLFCKTIIMMVIYSMGLKVPQMSTINTTTLVVLVNPFVMLMLAFVYNYVDGFRLSRFTFLLTIWSLCAGGMFDYRILESLKPLFLLAVSALTIYLTMSTDAGYYTTKLNDSYSSFHKIYSEDCFSDEDTRETISLINQKFNSSNTSSSGRSWMSSPPQSSNRRCLTKSPLVSSNISLNGIRSPSSPNHTIRNRLNYAASLGSIPTNSPSFGSPFHNEYAYHHPNVRTPMRSPLLANAETVHRSYPDDLSKYHNNPHYISKASVASPLSPSNTMAYERSNLLSPSHFSDANHPINNPRVSWLSGGYFNGSDFDITSTVPEHSQDMYMEQRSGMQRTQADISRASSQSSGFESQSSTAVRENSICPDQDLYAQSSAKIQNGFCSLENKNLFTGAPSLLNVSSFHKPRTNLLGSISEGCQMNHDSTFKPLSVNCSGDSWKPMRTQFSNSVSNAFNLRQINDELPTIQRGSLLKKWMLEQKATNV